MPKLQWSNLRTLVLFGVLVSLSASTNTVHAHSLSRRVEQIPWIDYEGIKLAASEALDSDVQRRALADSAGGYPHLEAREPSTSARRCKKIEKRKEWRQLSYGEKKDYIRAIKCLQTRPDYGISPITNNLYDAFTQVHTTDFGLFHISSPFLPWHRWFVWIHNEALKHECGYTGPAPYWDYTKDYKNPTGSPIFSTDPEIGFGTHGSVVLNELGRGGFKVDNGAFANFKVNIPIPHYLTRNFTYWKEGDPDGFWGYQLGESFSPRAVQKLLSSPTFWDLEVNVDALNVTGNFGIHNSPHYLSMGDWVGPAWVAGTKFSLNGTTAPNDPMFWPHHQNVDRIFWTWQQKPGKQWEYNGKQGTHTDFPELNPPEPADAHLSDILPFFGLGPDVPVALAFKTENWPLCYTY
ncbi:hypothetical protein M408DRAFT_24137 [Serendipita vermifera MAFF 305830]|uniref:Tyrosinase copper-binding domain-containing protein n=1 Tax=Serendipita vermifera MAFF 305830 TaxID=933852 RepID=A0A0C3B7P4_SERVB|nr:hypothetical protein M408DRAFT_24137 [Serendipita vermifera MAFF 305830]